jgi:signal transduction histidine kinase/PAS domain-containing protein
MIASTPNAELAAPMNAAVAGEVRRQQQIYLVKQVPIVMAVNLINGLLVAILFTAHGYATTIGLWYAALAALTGLQFLGWRRVRKLPVPTTVSGRSLRQAEIWSAVLGGLWGSTALIVMTPSVPDQMFLAVLLAGMTAGTTSILNPLPRVTAHFVIAALVPLVLRMLIEAQTLHLIVACLAIVFAGALLRGSLRAYQQFAELIAKSHALNEARADMVDALESSDDAFAMFDAHGKLSIANKRFREWFPGEVTADAAHQVSRHQEVNGSWLQSAVLPTSRGGRVAVHSDISKLKQRETELIESMREAQEANRAKSDFLANMSHELRTPLNAIIGFSEMMHGEVFGALGHAKYRDYNLDIFNSATHLLSIIQDILDLSKIESSRYEISPERTDVRDVARWVATLCANQPRTEHRGAPEQSISPDFGLVMVDPRAFKQILLNLVNNAYKFTPDTGRIGIEARILDTGEPAVTVWDTGIGIPADKLEHVRKPFHQVEGAFQRKFQGTGLGLSISEALTKLHGGKLVLESELGAGTRVTVVFPADIHLAAPQAPASRTAAE